MNMNEPPSLLRNDVTGGGHWLKVQLVGVEVEPQRDRRARHRPLRRPQQAQEVLGAVELLLGQRSPPALRARRRDHGGPEIRWPNGATEKMPNVDADQLVVIREGARHRPSSEVWMKPL